MTLVAPETADDPGRSSPRRQSTTLWQRTDTVGTELVIHDDGQGRGESVVAGPPPYATTWQAHLDSSRAVRDLTVTCRGAGWERTVWLRRDEDGWSCRTEQVGDLDATLARIGRAPAPLAGIEDPGRLDAGGVLSLTHSPIFVTWAAEHLELTAQRGLVGVATVRVLVPSLTVLPGLVTYQLLSPGRLRVWGDEPATVFDLGTDGIVTAQPGRCRLVR